MGVACSNALCVVYGSLGRYTRRTLRRQRELLRV